MSKREEYDHAARTAVNFRELRFSPGECKGVNIQVENASGYSREEYRQPLMDALSSLKDVIEARVKANLSAAAEKLKDEAIEEAAQFIAANSQPTAA